MLDNEVSFAYHYSHIPIINAMVVDRRLQQIGVLLGPMNLLS